MLEKRKIWNFQIADVEFYNLRKLFAVLESVQKRVNNTENSHAERYQASAWSAGVIRHGKTKKAEHEKLIYFKIIKISKSWIFQICSVLSVSYFQKSP